jgi:hypothetical protein
MKHVKWIILLIVITTFLPVHVIAEDIPADSDQFEPDSSISPSENWEFTFIPYFWMLGIDGDVTVNGTKSPVSISFGEIFDNLNFGVMGVIKVRKGRVGAYFDGIFAVLETNRKTVQTGNGPARIKVEIDLAILEGGGSIA